MKKTINPSNITTIGIDADDTLWVNEPIFRNAEREVAKLVYDRVDFTTFQQILLEIEIKNLPVYGFGIKGFVLSAIEAVTRIGASSKLISKILEIGKKMYTEPNPILEGVHETLDYLNKKYQLLLITKGDLLDQERKIVQSGLVHFFTKTIILSDKKSKDYQKVLNEHSILPSEFVMIGNSLKSDVLPVVELGGQGIHIPFEITWEMEKVEHHTAHDSYLELSNFAELKELF